MRSRLLLVLLSLSTVGMVTLSAQTDPVPAAINQLGLELLRAQHALGTGGESNQLLSPYSIQAALALAYVGADGATRAEMQRVLHLPDDDAAVTSGFSRLAGELTALQEESRRRADEERQYGVETDPVIINVANRLFAQRGFDLRPAYVALLRDEFQAPLVECDFERAPEKERAGINAWVEEQTRDKIRDLIPGGMISSATRTVLVNALYLRAPWAEAFRPERTKPEPFWIAGRTRAEVPTMFQRESCRYAQRDGFQVVALPYQGGQLQFVILLPAQRDGLATLEKVVTPDLLAACATLPFEEVILRLPRFKIEPPSMLLGERLRQLGLNSAFDVPAGSANFDRMAPRRTTDYLAISEVVHKTWLALDEKGTEAAAATAVVMRATSAPAGPTPPPVEVRVDRPFLFAIQHVPSGACLFLGYVVDPR